MGFVELQRHPVQGLHCTSRNNIYKTVVLCSRRPGCSQAQDSEEKGRRKNGWTANRAHQENWEYKGQSYKACSKTPNTDYNWCYVIGQTLTDCPAAQDSLLMASEGEQRKWRKCGDSKGT